MRIVQSVGMLLVVVCMAQPSAAAADPLVLQKTVGVESSGCAPCGITVTAGTNLTYCYQVTNNSGITLTTHDLFDDQFGTLLSGAAIVVVPGASTFFTVTTPITMTTVNVATWTAQLPGVITVTAVDSCLVSVPEETDGGPASCGDGIDNDMDGFVDCADSDCAGVGACVASAPALGPGGLVAAGLLLLSFGVGSLLRRRS